MQKPRIGWLLMVAIMLWTSMARAEEVRIVTYNVEHWSAKFDTKALAAWAKKQPESEELNNLIRTERNQDDEDNWEVAQTIQNKKLNPDIMVFQEGCSQEDLDAFNKKWLDGAYATAKVFPGNSGRAQYTGILMKPGFEILETRDQYYKEKDTVPKDFLKTDEGDEPSDAAKENRLFARGPAFVKVKTPGGYVFWMGTNHQKSKSGNSADVTAWRNREAKRTHEIILELASDGTDVVFAGDMNDELGIQEFELQGGGDVIANLVGTDGKVLLATRELDAKGEISFGGYNREFFRSFIDHVFVSASLKDRIVSVSVFKEDLARVASDHYPVLMVIRSPDKK